MWVLSLLLHLRLLGPYPVVQVQLLDQTQSQLHVLIIFLTAGLIHQGAEDARFKEVLSDGNRHIDVIAFEGQRWTQLMSLRIADQLLHKLGRQDVPGLHLVRSIHDKKLLEVHILHLHQVPTGEVQLLQLLPHVAQEALRQIRDDDRMELQVLIEIGHEEKTLELGLKAFPSLGILHVDLGMHF